MTRDTKSYKNTYSGGPNWTQAHSAGRALRESIREQLHTKRFGHCFLAFQEIDSTNTAAAEWAAKGAKEGAVVTAEVQASGRGRFGRRWMTAPGQNLTFSIVLQPELPADEVGQIVLAASVAVARAVAPETDPIQPKIKWPNDIMLNGRKCCGMLLETSTGGHPIETAGVAILGIGLNVNQDMFPPEISSTATSLLLEMGRITTRTVLLARILNMFEIVYDRVIHGHGSEVRQEYVQLMAGVGNRARVQNAGDGQSLVGTVRGITSTGALILETNHGLRHLQAGDVTLR